MFSRVNHITAEYTFNAKLDRLLWHVLAAVFRTPVSHQDCCFHHLSSNLGGYAVHNPISDFRRDAFAEVPGIDMHRLCLGRWWLSMSEATLMHSAVPTG